MLLFGSDFAFTNRGDEYQPKNSRIQLTTIHNMKELLSFGVANLVLFTTATTISSQAMAPAWTAQEQPDPSVMRPQSLTQL